MKKLLLTLAIALCYIGVAAAQYNPQNEMFAERKTK